MAALVLEDDADYVIIGTGAGGATAARILSDAGRSVLMLEEGPSLKTKDRPRDILGAMRTAMRDMGTNTTYGASPFPLLQGRCVGGSTALNSGIIWRLPEDCREEWVREWGLGELLDPKGLSDAFDVLERELEVSVTGDAVLGTQSEKMALACERLGLPGKPITRNASRCKGTANCLQGCPTEARQSMDVSYVPRAIRQGARLHDLCRVDKLVIRGNRAVAVEGVRLERDTRKVLGRFVVRAKRGVILAASAVYSPALLRRAGIKGMVGERFQAHPGAAVVGRFDESISMGQGATQGYEVPLREKRLKIESLTLPPEMLASRIPGCGPAWQARMTSLDQYAQWSVLVRMKAHGTVRPLPFGHGTDAVVRFDPLPEDMLRMREGLATVCRMMFAAGAREVFPGVAGFAPILTRVEEVEGLERYDVKPTQLNMMCSHLFGSATAGSDPSRAAVSPELAVHGVDGLYVMDASVLPTNLGVNPQHTIMGVVWRAAERLANASRATVAA